MTTPPNPPDMTAMAGDLGKKLDGVSKAMTNLADEIKDLRVTVTKTRRRVHFLVPVVAFDILLSVGLGLTSAIAIHASDRAQTAAGAAKVAALANAANAVKVCQASNDARTQAVSLWIGDSAHPGILTLQPAQTVNPAEKAVLDRLRALVETTYAQRKC